jgi:chromosome segregation ATPase
MRTLSLLFVLTLLFACSNVSQFEAPIQELSIRWETERSSIASTVEEISRSQEVTRQVLEKMASTEENAARAGEAYQSKLATLQQEMQSKSSMLGQISQQTSEFLTEWQTGTLALADLKTGLADGRMPGNAKTSIDNLNALATKAGENSKAWMAQLLSINAELDIIIESFSNLAAGM